MTTIQHVWGSEVFLFDISKSPNKLILTIHDAALVVQRQATAQ